MIRLPNILTVLRIALVPVFAIAFVLPGDTARLVAFGVFCIAGLSDALDGLAARKLNAGSDFGRMLDPIADKILVGVALMMLVAEGTINQFNLDEGLRGLLKLVPALVILVREFLVSGLREFLAGADVSVPVSFFAKIKTTIQMFAIGAMILGPMADKVRSRRARLRLCGAVGGRGADGGDGLCLSARRAGARAPAAASQQRDAGVKLLYFAWVRQKVGKSEETLALPAGVSTVRDLAGHLRTRGPGYAEAFGRSGALAGGREPGACRLRHAPQRRRRNRLLSSGDGRMKTRIAIQPEPFDLAREVEALSHGDLGAVASLHRPCARRRRADRACPGALSGHDRARNRPAGRRGRAPLAALGRHALSIASAN